MDSTSSPTDADTATPATTTTTSPSPSPTASPSPSPSPSPTPSPASPQSSPPPKDAPKPPPASLKPVVPPKPSTPHDLFLSHMAAKKPLGDLLKKDQFEKLFDHAVRARSEPLLEYLSEDEIVAEFLGGLVSADRPITEASQALSIILSNLEKTSNCIVNNHLTLLFSFLEIEKLEPRRAYFFLRAVSFLHQNRVPEMAKFIRENNFVVKNMMNHLTSTHILQLILNMLAVERQYSGMPGMNWSEEAGLVTSIVAKLAADPENTIESVIKFFVDLSLSYTLTSPLIKGVPLAGDGVLLSTISDLMLRPSTSSGSVDLLTNVILPILKANVDDEQYYGELLNDLKKQAPHYLAMLSSRSMQVALAGAKLVATLLQRNVILIELEAIVAFVDLLFKYKWANVVHDVISTAIIEVFAGNSIDTQSLFLEDKVDLVGKISKAILTEDSVGYKGHSRLIANALAGCQEAYVEDILSKNEAWLALQPPLHSLNEANLTFREAEMLRQMNAEKAMAAAKLVVAPQELGAAKLPPPSYAQAVQATTGLTPVYTSPSANGLPTSSAESDEGVPEPVTSATTVDDEDTVEDEDEIVGDGEPKEAEATTNGTKGEESAPEVEADGESQQEATEEEVATPSENASAGDS